MAQLAATPARPTAPHRRPVWRQALPYLLIAPSLAVFLLFEIYPISYSLYLSFTKWNLISPTKTWVGLANYQDLLTSAEFHRSLINTLLYTAGRVIFSLSFALAMAILVNSQKRWASWVQAAIFSPHVISMVSVSLLWLWLMDPTHGLLNYLLGLVGIPSLKWLGASSTALLSLIIVAVWKVIGYDMLIFLAGLQSIPAELQEAAKIDGAGPFRRFWSITLPLLSPTLFFLSVTSIISSFQVFDIVRVMTGGGPGDSTNVLVYYIYQYGFRYFKIGHSSAASIVLLVLVLGLTLLQFRVLERRVHYD